MQWRIQDFRDGEGGRGAIPKGRRCQPIIRQYLSINCMRTIKHSSRMRTARSSSHLLRGACLSACWDTYHPLPTDVGLETPPGQTPQLPPVCGTGDLQCMLEYHFPPASGQKPAMHAGIPPPPV